MCAGRSVRYATSTGARTRRKRGIGGMRILTYTLLGVAVATVVFGTAATTFDFSAARTVSNEMAGASESSAQVPGADRVCPTGRVFLHVEDREGLGDVLTWELRRQLQ